MLTINEIKIEFAKTVKLWGSEDAWQLGICLFPDKSIYFLTISMPNVIDYIYSHVHVTLRLHCV